MENFYVGHLTGSIYRVPGIVGLDKELPECCAVAENYTEAVRLSEAFTKDDDSYCKICPNIKVCKGMILKYNEKEKKEEEKKMITAMSNVEKHEIILKELNALYARKNHDYGDSFHQSWVKFGLPMLDIRLSDKMNRLDSFITGKELKVTDEAIRDTLMDIANYAIMGVMELDRDSEANQ